MPRLCSSLLLSLLIASSASAVTMDWTPIGNPGNALRSAGDATTAAAASDAVGYAYRSATYEVTNAQYAEFLNAKAAADPTGLYNTSMGVQLPDSAGSRAAAAPGATRTARSPGRENMPVNYVSFYDALRFANWMNNGQGNGDTETGAYTLLDGTTTPSNGRR